MAADTVPPPVFQRSFSDGPPESFGMVENVSMRSINPKKSIRSHSIVGALWKYLYTPRHGSNDLSHRTPSSSSEGGDDTDHGAAEEGLAKQEEAQLQAYYTGVALVVLLVAGLLCWSVYCVLEPFLHPLLWAILTGILLYPVKKVWTKRIGQWLDLLEMNSIPLSAGLVLSPLFLFNYLSKYLETTVVENWRLLLGSAVAMVSLWLLHKLSFLTILLEAITEFYSYLLLLGDMLTDYAFSLLLSTLFLTTLFALLVVKHSKEEYALHLTSLSILVWFLVLLNIAAYLLGNTLALPLVIGLFVTGGVVSFGESLRGVFGGVKTKKRMAAKLRRKGRDEGKRRSEGEEERGIEEEEQNLEEVMCLSEEIQTNNETEREAETPIRPILSDPENAIIIDNTPLEEPDYVGLPEPEKTKSHVSFGPIVRISPEEPVVYGEEREGDKSRRPHGLKRRSPTPPPRRDSSSSEDEEESSTSSDYIFLGLYCTFFVMLFWNHPFLFVLLVPFALWGSLKRAVAASVTTETPTDRLKPFAQGFSTWTSVRRPLLFPSPLPTLSRLFLSLDHTVLVFAKGSVDSIISGFIIISLLVSGLGLTVFLVLQIQVELSHYVTMMSAIWESTLEGNPQLAEWIGAGGGGGGGEGGDDGEAQSIKDTIGSFATQGYIYGREWLAGQVQSALGDSTEKGGAFEQQVLNLYDQLYQSYVLANSTTTTGSHVVNNDGDLLNELKIVVMENLETVVSVLKTMWLVLADNLSLALSLLYTFLGLLLSGGTALINTVVFLTTLFYLLCYSTDVYLPVKIVTDILPSVTQSDTTNEYTASLSRAIRSVFHASFSRLVFYGLYTWLVHVAFGLPVSILPAVLAAIAGALPFVGTYWIALPAVLELWLVEGETLSAITVLVLSLLPLFFVDSVIYGEVEGGHPYLTGLAVAGGIYFAGLEGALIGPILLCCLVFIHELFGELFTQNSDPTS